MDPQTQQYLLIAAIVIGVLLLIGLLATALRARRERRQLRERFGDEYDRTVEARGSKRKAVRDLKERQKLRSELELRDLNEADRTLVRQHMAVLQYRFVEDPPDVMMSTARVVTEVLRAKGYPVAEDRERALRLFSVDHPEHAGAVRKAIEGEHHNSLDRMRDTFVGVRAALEGAAEISYDLPDVTTDAPEELRVESGGSTAALPEGHETQHSTPQG